MNMNQTKDGGASTLIPVVTFRMKMKIYLIHSHLRIKPKRWESGEMRVHGARLDADAQHGPSGCTLTTHL